MSFLDEINFILKQKSLLNHPFYQLWQQGKLPINALQGYASEYYHLEYAFPSLLLQVSIDADEEATETLIVNYADETANGKSHSELWLDFAEGIGCSRDKIKKGSPSESVRAAILNLRSLASQSLIKGVSALLAYESNLQETAATKIHSLQEFYGISNSKSTEFFTIHSTLDIKHASEWKTLLANAARTDDEQRIAKETVSESMDVLWRFLDGVQQKYGMGC